MSRFLSRGMIAAYLTIGAAVAGASGHPVTAHFLADPLTADNVNLIVVSVFALIAGACKGVQK